MFTDNTANKAENKVYVALIDSISLTRLSLTNFLSEHLSEAVVLPFVSSQQVCGGNAPPPSDLSLIIFHVGARPVYGDELLRSDIERLRSYIPGIPIVLFCDREDISCVVEALSKGVRGYIPTAFDTQVVIGALRLVLAGGIFVPAGPVLQALSEQSAVPQDTQINGLMLEGSEGFTPRQIEVLTLLKQGKPNKIIAYELDVEESTVKVHVRHIMRKLHATNRTHAVVLANQLCAT